MIMQEQLVAAQMEKQELEKRYATVIAFMGPMGAHAEQMARSVPRGGIQHSGPGHIASGHGHGRSGHSGPGHNEPQYGGSQHDGPQSGGS